jgi:hypothetical protein
MNLQFMLDNVTAHTENNTMDALGEVFFGLVIGRGFWPPRSFVPYGCLLWGTLKEKVRVKTRHCFEELQVNIRYDDSAISIQ